MARYALTPFFFLLAWLAVFAWPGSIVLGQSQWEKYVGNPVLSPELQSGTIAFSDPTLAYDGKIFHLWISVGGFVAGDTAAGVRTYYYTSSDGFSWQPNPINPVFREGAAGTWDSGHIETPSVIVSFEGFRLYYAATPDSMADDRTQLKIGLATSHDGATWVRHPANPILERGTAGSWEEQWIESPCVLQTDSLFYLWYSGVDIHWNIHVGLATSADGIVWQKYSGNPVFSPSQESDWDSVGVYAPQVRWLGDRFVMLYTGLVFSQTGYDFTNTSIGMAVSEDGIHWTRASSQPVLRGTPGAWDASGPFTLDWIETNDQLLMVYVSDGKVGIATSAIPSSIHYEPVISDFYLKQNYPNPFNPETVIEYQLPRAAEVEISIFNLQGQKVITLVRGHQTAGSHKIIWPGMDESGRRVASGLYVYQLQVGQFIESKKMIYLK